jgi:hypothetical protein
MQSTIRNLFLIIALLLTSSLFADAKRYDVKSGIITYKIEGGGSILGVTTKTSGTQKLYFKDYGNIEMQEIDEQTTTMGTTTKSHTRTKIVHGTVYVVDEDEKQIIKKDITMLKEMDKKGTDIGAMGKDMLQKMGGKKVGKGKVLGYPCEIWEIMGSKIWIYKGVPLKTEANIMGFKHLEVATSAKFNINVPDKYFKLPDYPVLTVDAMMRKAQEEAMQDEKTAKPKNTPAQQPQFSPEQMKQMQEMMQNLGKMFGGQ